MASPIFFGSRLCAFRTAATKANAGIGEVDARRVPLAELLRVALLPALQLLRQRGLHVAVQPHALGVFTAGDARHHRAVDLMERDEASLEAELARLLDDQADAARRREPRR